MRIIGYTNKKVTPCCTYQVRCKVENICKLIGIDSIIEVWSPLEEIGLNPYVWTDKVRRLWRGS